MTDADPISPLTPEDVQRALAAHGLGIKPVHFAESTATSELAAAAVGCEVGQIAKSLCFFVDGSPVLVVASGDVVISDARLAQHFGVGRKKVRMARAEQCIAVFGYAPGGVPPLAHRSAEVQVFLDRSLLRFERVYAAAGSANVNFGASPEELAVVSGGVWGAFAKDQ